MEPPIPTTSSASPPPSGASSKWKTFVRRLASTVLLWAVILGALFSGNVPLSHSVFLAIMLIIMGIGSLEFFGWIRARGWVGYRMWSLGVGAALTLVLFWGQGGWGRVRWEPAFLAQCEFALIALFLLGLLGRQLWAATNPHGLVTVGTTLLGFLYVPWLLAFLQKIYFFPGLDGTLYLFYFILVTKFSDTGAYLVGSIFGRHKMIPRISPGKTWEGFAGAVAVPVVASVVFVWLAGPRLAGMNWVHAVVLGVLLSLGAVVGDLIESLFKREAGVKDSGAYFPGIGGILDLVDSLLFNGPIMYFYLRFVVSP